MYQAGSDYVSDRGMLLGAWHLQLEQQRVAALGCVCASSLERSRRCQKVAPQLSSTSLADASRSAKREGKVVSNVSNPRSCLNPPSPPLGSVTVSPASFWSDCRVNRSQRWLLWSYVIVVVVVVMGNCYSFNMTRQSVLPSPPSLSLYTFAAVRLSIVLRANSSQPAPPILLPLSLPFPFTLSDSLKFV